MTAAGTIPDAVEAMRHGAYDFLTKPLEKRSPADRDSKALERDSLKRQVAALKSDVQNRYATIVGESQRSGGIIESAQRAAKSDASILLLGESRTGKELFARSIHQWSPVRACRWSSSTAWPSPKRCSRTNSSATNAAPSPARTGFRRANSKWQRAERFSRRDRRYAPAVAGQATARPARQSFNASAVPARCPSTFVSSRPPIRDLRQSVKAGQFREDLFFRLNVVSFTLPPLRERERRHRPTRGIFLKRHAYEAKRPGVTLSPAAGAALTHYSWPGNIRELDNVLSRAVVLSPSDVIEPEFLALTPEDAAGKGGADHALPLPESHLP